MILPIYSYGYDILRKECENINEYGNELAALVTDMWETMYQANGCGLAAPQIGKAVKLFIVDSKTTYQNLKEEERKNHFVKEDTGIRETFINAKIISYSEEKWEEEEGCLSIPHLAQKVIRSWSVTIEYLDKDFNKQTKTFHGSTARMVQHEYDHTHGVLFLDYLKPLARKLLEGKLKKISKGQLPAKYNMKYIK